MRPKVALLEASHWHVPLYVDRLRQAADVVAVSDRNFPAARRVAQALGAQAFTDWRDALATPGLDLVFIFGQHSTMTHVARAVVDLQIPFVLEKPGGVKSSEVATLASLAKRKGVSATVAFVQRVGPLVDVLSKSGRPDHLGFRFFAGPPSRYVAAGSSWILDRDRAGGGCFINLGIHWVDLFTLLVREPIALVESRMHRRVHGLAVEDHAVAVIETASGRSATIEVGYLFPDVPAKRDVNFYASGPGGFVEVHTDGRVVTCAPNGETCVERIDVDSDRLYDLYTSAVIDRLGDGFAGLPTLDDLSDAMAVVSKVYAAAAPLSPTA
jgi:predicted dehydrogenase